jgi:hypothetical protein
MTLHPTKTLLDAVKAVPQVAAACGNRVYPGEAPEGTKPPYVLVQRISEQRRGTLTEGEARPMASYRLELIDYSLPSLGPLEDALKAALDAWSSSDGVFVRVASIAEDHDRDARLARIILDLSVTYRS